MKLALIADIHGMLPFDIPTCDAVIIAGDIAPDGRGQLSWLNSYFPQWCEQTQAPIYVTWGNHDFTQGLTRGQVEENWPSNVFLVVDNWLPIGGKKVWFSPWSPKFLQWAWMEAEENLATKFKQIPDDIDIVVSHAPPYGAGDKPLPRSTRLGCKALAERMTTLPKLKHVVCGHIHEDRGIHILGGITVLNVAAVDGNYVPVMNPWWMIDI